VLSTTSPFSSSSSAPLLPLPLAEEESAAPSLDLEEEAEDDEDEEEEAAEEEEEEAGEEWDPLSLSESSPNRSFSVKSIEHAFRVSVGCNAHQAFFVSSFSLFYLGHNLQYYH